MPTENMERRPTTSVVRESAHEVRISLSWPPSTNNLFVNKVGGGGRIASQEYRRWRDVAGWELQAQRPVKFKGPVSVTVELCSPNGSYDPDNRLKAPLDLLVTHGVIKDDTDATIREVTARPVHDAAACTIIVRAA
jgi:crossover junction endodeoxyribonuclease RusA